jgi:translation elongation factor EF-1alpha
MKTILLIGRIGNGKSTTGNKLLRKDAFTRGSRMDPITKQVQFEVSADGQLTIFDCPGFGDVNDQLLFLEAFKKSKQALDSNSPVDGIILVVKFDKDQSNGLTGAAKEFLSAFGSLSIKSLMLLCIQGNTELIYSQGEFRDVLYNSEGYKFLKAKNNNNDIPYCLWDNFNEYFEQNQNFNRAISGLDSLDSVRFSYIFDFVDKEIENIKEKRGTS